MKKPPFIAHYLVLIDLINKVDVRLKADFIYYYTSRIENIKSELKNKYGLIFVENARIYTKYSWYKPYILVDTKENMKRAKELLKGFESPLI